MNRYESMLAIHQRFIRSYKLGETDKQMADDCFCTIAEATRWREEHKLAEHKE